MIVSNLLKLNLQSDYMCTNVLGQCASTDSHYQTLDPEDYVTKMLADKPAFLANDDFIDNLYKEIANDPKQRPTMKFVHFTDIHMDLLYRVGASKVCDDVNCCRASDGFPTNVSLQAGPLGTYGCDIPVDVVTQMGDIINKEVKPDVILWGGDVAPHDQNSYTYEYLTNLQKRLDDWFAANLT
jgi:hypothetical protein